MPSVHASKSGQGIPRLIDPNLEDCMHVWEAARATAATFPHFAPFTWQEKKLLDGGFRANCPAEIGYNEARCVWPERRLDVLVSLGTGSYHKKSALPPKNLALKVGRQFVEAITNSAQLWEAFQVRIGKDKTRCFRLDPFLTRDFGVADVKNLKNIADDTECWLINQGADLANIGNQLIASLFFCIAGVTTDASTWACNITCRLSAAVEGKTTLVDHLIDIASKRDLFTAKSSNCATVHCDAENALLDWRHTNSQGPIVVPLTISGLPAEGEVKIYISMADIFRDDSTHRYPVSGMPYVFRRTVQ